MAFLLFGTAVPLHAGVGMYFVDGMEPVSYTHLTLPTKLEV